MRTRRLVLAGLVAAVADVLAWGGVRYLDGTQAAAREYIMKAPVIVGGVGAVEHLTLYSSAT